MSKKIGLEPATIDAEFTLPDPESNGSVVFVPVPLTRSREQQFAEMQTAAKQLEERPDGPDKNNALVGLMADMVDVVLTGKGDDDRHAGQMLRDGYEQDRMTLGQIAGWFAQVVGAAQDPTSARG